MIERRTALLFLIILIEGYVVLGVELLSIRQLIPFVGSGTEVISIIISAVLLPLAFGYHRGGRVRQQVRATLTRNILIALLMLGLGLTYGFLELFFGLLEALKIIHPVLQAALYALLFLARPIYLLGQTLPLVSNYFLRSRLSEMTGRILFVSTVGSFLGSVFSTLVLMNTIGVHHTVIVTLGLLASLVPLLARRGAWFETSLAGLMVACVMLMNSGQAMRSFGIVANNSYNMTAVKEDPKTGNRLLRINRSNSSAIAADGTRIFPYARYIEEHFITPTKADTTPRDFLIIGAGGFTIGLDDTQNRYTYVDIDPELKQVSEEHFLRRPLGANKRFVAASARAFTRRSGERYDLVLVDCYTHIISMPLEATTREFLDGVKALLKPGGVVIVNQIISPDFRDTFSVRYDATFREVFPHFSRQVMGEFNPWSQKRTHAQLPNVLYIYYDRPYGADARLYSDDRNTYSMDRH